MRFIFCSASRSVVGSMIVGSTSFLRRPSSKLIFGCVFLCCKEVSSTMVDGDWVRIYLFCFLPSFLSSIEWFGTSMLRFCFRDAGNRNQSETYREINHSRKNHETGSRNRILVLDTAFISSLLQLCTPYHIVLPMCLSVATFGVRTATCGKIPEYRTRTDDFD